MTARERLKQQIDKDRAERGAGTPALSARERLRQQVEQDRAARSNPNKETEAGLVPRAASGLDALKRNSAILRGADTSPVGVTANTVRVTEGKRLQSNVEKAKTELYQSGGQRVYEERLKEAENEYENWKKNNPELRSQLGEKSSLGEEINYQAGKLLKGAAGAVQNTIGFVDKLVGDDLAVLGSLVDATTGRTQFEKPIQEWADKALTTDIIGADKFGASVEDKMADKKPSKVRDFVGGISESAGAMLPAIATGNIAGSAGLGAGTTQALNYLVFGSGAAGSAAKQALDEGADMRDAVQYGLFSGMMEVLSESMFAGIAGMNPSGVLDDVMKKLTQNGTMRFIGNTLGEGLEETVVEFLAPYIKRATYDPDAANATLNDLARSFASGAAMSFLMSGANAIASGDPGSLVRGTRGTTEQNVLQDKYGRVEEQTVSDVFRSGEVMPERTIAPAENGTSETALLLPAAEEMAREELQARALAMPEIRPTETVSVADMETLAENARPAQEADIEAAQERLNQSVREQAKKTLGQQGYRAFESAVREVSNLADYYGELSKAYNEGVANKRGSSKMLSPAQYDVMYTAGKADATASIEAQAAQKGFATVHGKDSGLVYDPYVANRLDRKTAKVLDATAKALGLKVQFADSVGGGSANAQLEKGIVLIEQNNPNPVRFLFGHEITHRMQELAPAEYARLREAIAADGNWLDAAIKGVQANYSKHGMTISSEAAMDEAIADYVGTMLEDSGALERFISKHQTDRTLLQKLRDFIRDIVQKLKGGEQAKQLRQVETRLSEVLGAAVEQAKINTEAQKNAAQESDVKYSIHSRFYEQLDKWDQKTTGFSFVVGETSTALQEAGIPLKQIRLDATKVAALLNKHNGMTIPVVKQIPELLENPVVVIDSKKGEHAKIVMGELRDENQKTVTVVLLLTPTSKNGNVLDIIKVSSAEGRGHIGSLFTKEDGTPVTVRYVDKKRIQNWLNVNRLQLPLHNLGSDSNIKVAQDTENVKMENADFSIKDSDNLVREIVRIQKEGAKNNRSEAEIKADIQAAVEKVYAGMLGAYGAIPTGEKPARDVQIPEWTDRKMKDKVSLTARTIMEAGVTPDHLLPELERMVATREFSYTVYSDKAAKTDADNFISNKGWNNAYAEWSQDVKKGVVSKKNTAVGWSLFNNAVTAGDTATALDILTLMVGHQRNAAQAVQATRILKQLGPSAELYGVQRSVSSLQDELNERFGSDKVKLEINQELAEQLVNERDAGKRDEILRNIYRDIGRQMPSTFRDKWNAWRYLAMLGNPRTHVRNILGNAFFMPVVATKDLAATVIEYAVYKVSRGKLERSKSMPAKALLSAAWGDYAKVSDQISGGGKYSDFANANKHIEEGRQVFKSKLGSKTLEKVRRGNSNLLEAEDAWFSQPHYAFALAQYCKANGITEQQIQEGKGKALDKARAYAIREAQKATYRDTNALSQFLSKRLSENGEHAAFGKAVNMFIEGVLPFRRTPANILVRGIEYSPLGLMNGIKKAVWDVRKGKSTGAEAIDSISAGLTGTGLLRLGLYLASQGLIRGSGGGDENEREFEELMGHQAYSLELPGGKSITLDWLAPECLPFFVGVNMWEQMQDGTEGATLDDALSAIGSITEPLLEMSCLQSLNDLFDAVGYASSEGLGGLPSTLASAATSYVTQALPTIGGQIERTGENTRYTTYTEAGKFLTKDMQYTIGKATNRIPGVDYQQIPYIDAWGRTESTGSEAERAFNNFINPAYTSDITTSAMEEELLRLYEQTGESSVFPSRAARYFTVDKERKDLTAEEYVKYATAKGEKAYDILTELTESKAYEAMDNPEKVDIISRVYTYANATAKTAVSDYEPALWISKAMKTVKSTGISEAKYIALYVQQNAIESLKDRDGDNIAYSQGLQIMDMIYKTPGLTEKQRKALFRDFGVSDKISQYNRTLVAQKLKEMRAK